MLFLLFWMRVFGVGTDFQKAASKRNSAAHWHNAGSASFALPPALYLFS
jgi:hypothetical protein